MSDDSHAEDHTAESADDQASDPESTPTEPMDTTTATADDDSPADQDSSGLVPDGDTGQRDIRRMAMWAAFGILVLVALIATLQFYLAASAVISEFVTRRYRPLFRAGFNLVVLLAAGIGISVLVRRLA